MDKEDFWSKKFLTVPWPWKSIKLSLKHPQSARFSSPLEFQSSGSFFDLQIPPLHFETRYLMSLGLTALPNLTVVGLWDTAGCLPHDQASCNITGRLKSHATPALPRPSQKAGLDGVTHALALCQVVFVLASPRTFAFCIFVLSHA